MRKIKEVLRLKYEANLSFRQIAASVKLSVGVISKYTQAAVIDHDGGNISECLAN